VVDIRRARSASGQVDLGRALDRGAELAAADGEDAAALADLVFLGAERHRRVGLVLRLLVMTPRHRVERELVAVPRVGHRLRALHDVQAEVERVAAEDVAHVVAADDHHLEADFLGDALQPGRAHLARRPDREPVAGDHERLAGGARAEVGHQVAERARLPALVERLEALGHAVGRRRDLVGVDRVELPVCYDSKTPHRHRLFSPWTPLVRRRPNGADTWTGVVVLHRLARFACCPRVRSTRRISRIPRCTSTAS
jgi:hypothetical protein